MMKELTWTRTHSCNREMNNFPGAVCPREASLFLPFLLRVPVWEKQGFIERPIITTENIGAAI
jgi:hypothetical protein